MKARCRTSAKSSRIGKSQSSFSGKHSGLALFFDMDPMESCVPSRRKASVQRRPRDRNTFVTTSQQATIKRAKQESIVDAMSRLATDAVDALEKSLQKKSVQKRSFCRNKKPIRSKNALTDLQNRSTSWEELEKAPQLSPFEFLNRIGLCESVLQEGRSQSRTKGPLSTPPPPKLINLKLLDNSCSESPCTTPSRSPSRRPSVGNVTPATAQAARYLLQLNR
ncbi:hypothetical protein FGB62_127g034 [Gracilaria domingensis]|nr:hypothetical protein FGB62_127g034 [Gracilaria domingensis]